jgi:hypothetical protein
MNRHSVVLLSFLPMIIGYTFSANTLTCHRGLQGHVYQVSGNQMPSPEEKPVVPKGIRTTLYIYDLTNISQVSRQGDSPFYTSIQSKLVKTIETDENGYFRIKLKPGMYSLFIKKDDLFYSSQFDEKNNIHPVEVRPGKFTEVVFHANYNAVY